MHQLMMWIALMGMGGAGATEAPAAPASAPLVSTFVAATVEEGIWTWVERMEGEILPDAAHEALMEDAAARMVDRALSEGLGGVDVPHDIYDDPVAVFMSDPLFLDEILASDFDLPIELHASVVERLRLFLGPQRKYFQRWLERSGRYRALIEREVQAAGMPQDLLYLSMIESGFNPYAYSHASAGGLWQFIPSTAVMYDLDVDWWVDERRDPEKATRAALRMLGELHEMFGDWYLAFAAYNTGPGRVRRALKRAKKGPEATTYWDLVEEDLLHRETKGYVPKIVAAAIIGKYPERYGFTDLQLEDPLEYETVVVRGPVEVAVLAKCAEMEEDELRALNPALRRYATPEGDIDIRIPVGIQESFLAAYEAVPPSERITVVKHKIRSGESLSTIGAKYGLSSAAIARANGIKNVHRIRAGQWLIVPLKGSSSPAVANATVQVAQPTSRTSSRTPKVVPESHTVRSGETLSTIADRYGLATRDVQSWNSISNAARIRVGQVLTLQAPKQAVAASSNTGSSTSTTATQGSVGSGSTSTYVVRSGDTLSEIAERFDVGTADLKAWNGIRDPRALRVGDKLTIRGGSATQTVPTARATTYTVRSGDTLSEIAEHLGVRTSDLKAWNGIRDPRSIRVGQTLKVLGASEWQTHVVVSGDTLGGIAARYGTSVRDLRAWNGISGNTIHPGQSLKVGRGR